MNNEAAAFEKALRREKPTDELEQAFRQGYLAGRSDSRLERIAYHYGYESQREQLIEECAEAILAAQKCKRHGSHGNFVNLCEEVADVLIMAQQMRILMSTSLIDSFIDKKLNRQLGRIENEEP
jgi:NTP pyrophosphatase (non-canonical NTP hydrolase)